LRRRTTFHEIVVNLFLRRTNASIDVFAICPKTRAQK